MTHIYPIAYNLTTPQNSIGIELSSNQKNPQEGREKKRIQKTVLTQTDHQHTTTDIPFGRISVPYKAQDKCKTQTHSINNNNPPLGLFLVRIPAEKKPPKTPE
jgi:hypothetical protein